MGAPASRSKNSRTKGLTQKQENFALKFVECGNATEAYSASYDAHMTKSTLAAAASRVLNTPKVVARINELRADAVKRASVTPERIAQELAHIAFGDQRRVMSWSNSGVDLKNSEALDDGAAATVSEVSETVGRNGRTMKLKSHDKVRALELLGRYLGMFKDKPDGAPPGASAQHATMPSDPMDASKAYKDLMG